LRYPDGAVFLTISALLLLSLMSQQPAAPATRGTVKRSTPHYDSYLTGQAGDVARATRGGLLLAGGGTDQPDAFRWLIDRAGGGDIVIIRASGADGYNNFLMRLGPVDSVQSIVFRSREASSDPEIVRTLERAEAVFLAGGDQSNYVRYWKNTPVQDALHALAKRGVPIGGTSAGLAVLGEFGFAATGGGVTSAAALANPYSDRVTIERAFLRLPHLSGIITDSHFVERDRLGRTLAFLARIVEDGWAPRARAIAIDRETAVLVEADGSTSIVGKGPAYFLQTTRRAAVCKPDTPLTIDGVETYRATAGATFNLTSWTGTGGTPYVLSVNRGTVTSSTGTLY
jgi:cyanophycinase